MLTIAYKVGRGVWTPPFLADILYEQPLAAPSLFTVEEKENQGKKNTPFMILYQNEADTFHNHNQLKKKISRLHPTEKLAFVFVVLVNWISLLYLYRFVESQH